MKKRLLASLLALLMVFALLSEAGAAVAPPQDQVYASIIALKSSYPEGMRWTNDNYYAWKGGIYTGGYGCAGFAYLLSDAAFGSMPARIVAPFQYSDVRVGDILRINSDTHSVVVLEVHENNVIIAEGNFNSSIHWGRSLSRQEVLSASYLMTRYIQQDDAADFDIVNGVLVKYKGKGGAVVIPQGVTSIGEGAFQLCSSVTSVIIPDGVTEIGYRAFWGCGGLVSVTIPSSVTSIGEVAFSGCPALTGVTIPDSVTSIGEGAFSNTGLTGVTIPKGVTSVAEHAFFYCLKLTSVTIPNGVTSIGELAFASCPKLTSVTIPGSVTSIGEDAFKTTPWLKQQGEFPVVNGILLAYQGNGGAVAIPNGVTSIAKGAFMSCTSLTSVTIPNGVTSIAEDVFRDCTSLTSVTIPNSVTSIGDFAFDHCGLTSVTIGSGVTSIEGWAFRDCNGLKDVYYAGTEAQWKAIKIDNDGNNALLNATIHYNGTSTTPTQPQQPTLPSVEDIPATGTAVPTPQTVKLNGKDVQFQTYALKDEKGYLTNYVKIRDLAGVLDGTKAQFNAKWDGKISIIPNTAYQPDGTENKTPYSGNQTYKAVSDTPVSFNGSDVKLTSFQITYQGGGYTYYKLLDLARLLNFDAHWDGSVKSIVIETDKPHAGN